jgi:hypothetical protein
MKPPDKAFDKKYDTYVEHPRYGRRPRFTALNPDPSDPVVNLHWNATNVHEIQKRTKRILGKKLGFLTPLERITPRESPRIAGTAIRADPTRQKSPTVPVTHYYDLEKICRNCKRPFIFFAEEQQYWYETMRFPLEADCVRCPECRKKERYLARNRATYETLAADKNRDWRANLKMAGCALVLVEHGVFRDRVVERIKSLLKSVPEEERQKNTYQDLVNRVKQLGLKRSGS